MCRMQCCAAKSCFFVVFFQVGIKARPGFVLSIWYHDNLRGHSDRGTDNDTSVTFLLSLIKINECCILHRHDKKKIAQDKTLDTHTFLFGYIRFLIWERNTEVAAKRNLAKIILSSFPSKYLMDQFCTKLNLQLNTKTFQVCR